MRAESNKALLKNAIDFWFCGNTTPNTGERLIEIRQDQHWCRCHSILKFFQGLLTPYSIQNYLSLTSWSGGVLFSHSFVFWLGPLLYCSQLSPIHLHTFNRNHMPEVLDFLFTELTFLLIGIELLLQ